jgi:phage FluMu gp28-like protein
LQKREELEHQIAIQEIKKEEEDITFKWLFASKDPLYFLGEFVYTCDPHSEPTTQKFPIQTKPYLKYLAEKWMDEPLLLVAKSRQMLITWLFIALYVWDSIMHQGRYTFFQSKKEDDSGNLKIPLSLLSRAKFIIDNLPPLVKPLYQVSQTPCIIYFPTTTSTIHAISQDSDAVRQYTATGILADELAFQENAEEAFRAVIPTLAGKGRFTGISSSNGKNFFYRLYSDKE